MPRNGFTLIELLIVVADHRHSGRHRDPGSSANYQAEGDRGVHEVGPA